MTYQYQQALHLIQIAKAQNAQKLDLTDLGLTQIPKEISELKQLSNLILTKNEITDYSVLQNLPQLKKLGVRRNKLKDISSLKPLKQLEFLDISFNSIEDYTPLKDLTNLNYLWLSGTIQNYDFLADLPSLAHLNLSHTRIQDYRFLKNIKKLLVLELEQCELKQLNFLSDLNLEQLYCLNLNHNQIESLNELVSLANLEVLALSYNKKITDIAPLARLKKLKSLYLRDNQITNFTILQELPNLVDLNIGQNNIEDITFLRTLTQLKKLNLISNHQLKNLDTLQFLTQLTELNLAYIDDIKDFSFIQSLTELTTLFLIRNGIPEVSFLKRLTNLQFLSLEFNKIKHFPTDFLTNCKNLIYLNLLSNPIENIPIELLGKSGEVADENCCFNLRHYFSGLAKGSSLNDTLKVAFVGNARVGKTSLMRALAGEPFNSQEESTHSIYLKTWQATPDVRLNLWDFGGQHLYHTTHRLFLRTKALFVLVWEQQNDKLKTVDEINPFSQQKFSFTNHKPLYWLTQINALSKNAPIFLVQSKMEAAQHYKEIPIDYPIWKKNFHLKDTFHIDSETKRGIQYLKDELIHYSEQIIAKQPLLPLSWHQVRQRIHIIQNFNNETRFKGEYSPLKQLPITLFLAICKDCALIDPESLTLLKYLHDTGEIIHIPQLFDSQIIIDKEWLISAIYTLFDRKNHFYKIINKGGRFSFSDLNEQWNQANHTFEEQKLFIQYMEQCSICFEIYYGKTDFNEKEWIAPALMQATPPYSVMGVFEDKLDCVWMQMRHELFYYEMIQTFIVRARHLSSAHEMWRYGIYLHAQQAKALIHVKATENDEITSNYVYIQVKGAGKKELLDKIINEFKKIQDAIPELWVSPNGEDYIPLTEVEKYRSKKEFTWAGKSYFVSDFNLFFNVDPKLNFPIIPQLQNIQNTSNINNSPAPLKIVMMTANPTGTAKLNLDKEHSAITQKLEKQADKFQLLLRKAVSSDEFKEFSEILKPNLLHFSGHGEKGKDGGIFVQNDDKNEEKLISTTGLKALFQYFQQEKVPLKAVLLNACYSEEQAQAISPYVPYVIGTTIALGDKLAIAFSTGFYFKLAETNLDFESAFKSGRIQAIMEGATKSNFVLYKNGKILNI